MDCDVRAISNAVMIDSLDTIIKQESQKLEMDKNTGLLSNKSKVLKTRESLKENENIYIFKDLRSNLPKVSHSPILCHSHDRVNEIERLANLFTQSPGFFTTNNNKNQNNNRIHVKHSQLHKEKIATQTHNKLDNYKVLLNNNNENLKTPDTKVKRNVRFGEYSPHNPANQVNSHPFLGIGEYDDKKKKLLETQRKEYIEYLSKVKQEKNTSDLPKLAGFSCEEAFKTAMENNNSPEQIKLNNTNIYDQENLVQPVSFVDGVESCAFDGERTKEANRLKQEMYRFELSKQIEEKKRLELERKRKEQMDDEAIERAARDKEEKIKKEFEKEAEKRTLAQLQKQLQQEKLKNELMRKQNDLEMKSLNVQVETISRQVSKHVPSRHESFEADNLEEFRCPPESTFDNVPLPTTRVRMPRKIVYDDDNAETKSVNETRDVSCNTDTFRNPCMNQNTSPPITRTNIERPHVSFTRKPSLKRSEHNSAAVLPITKSVIIDSPFTLALAGLDDCEEGNITCEAIEPTEAANRNQVSEVLLGSNHELLTDKHLLSNLGNIRKQLGIEHQKLKQQVRKSQ